MAGARRSKLAKESAKGTRILIVEARFYDDIAHALLAGASKVLKAAGAEFDCITVPGSLEIPAAIAIAVDAAGRGRRRYDGVVALDGVSLTVNKVDGEMVSVLIIPHTLQVTTLGKIEPGARLNLEVDQLARYVARLMETLPRK